MSVYFTVFADTADAGGGSGNQAVYANARNSTASTVNTGSNVSCGQEFSTPNYNIIQYFGRFDTSAVPTGTSSGLLSLNCSFANAATTDTFEVREASSLANKIAGGSISALTLFGSVACPTATGRFSVTISDASAMSRSASLNLLVHSQNERLNVAPTVNDKVLFDTADAAGTTNDPYLSIQTGNTWQLVGVSNSVEVTGTSHALVTTGISGLQTGDLLVACISSRIASTTSITLPTGGEWTLVSEQKNNNTATNTSATPSGMMAYCVRGASDPNLTFTHPVAPSVALGRIVAYRNVDSSSPKDTQTSFTTATNVTAVSGTGLTTSQDDDLIVAMAAGGQEATWSSFAAATDPTTASGASNTSSNPVPNAWLERADANTVTGADTSLGIFDTVKTAAGVTGNLTVTASQGAAHVVVAGAFKLVPAAGGAVSASPTGASSTTAAGTPTVSGKANVSVTGTSATGSAGSPTVALNTPVTVTGVSATSAAGTPTVSGKANVTPTGVASTSAAGTPTVTGHANVSVTGVSATGSAGDVTVSFGTNANPSGVEATGSAGTPTVTGTANVTLTGVNSTSAAGTPTVTGTANVPVTGVAATSAADTPTVSGKANVSPTGVASATAAGTTTVTGTANVTLTGVAATGQAGTATVTAGGSVNVSVTGVETAGQAGTPTVSGKANVTPTGASAAGQVGSVAVSGAANVNVTGVASTSAANAPTATGAANVPVTGVEATGSAGDATVSVAGGVSVLLTGVEAVSFVGSVVVVTTGTQAEPEFVGDGIDYAKHERSREERDRKERSRRDDLTEIVKRAFHKVTDEPVPTKPVAPKVEKKIAKAALAEIKLSGLDDIELTLWEATRLVREYENSVLAQRQANDDEAIALLLLAS